MDLLRAIDVSKLFCQFVLDQRLSHEVSSDSLGLNRYLTVFRWVNFRSWHFEEKLVNLAAEVKMKARYFSSGCAVRYQSVHEGRLYFHWP